MITCKTCAASCMAILQTSTWPLSGAAGRHMALLCMAVQQTKGWFAVN